MGRRYVVQWIVLVNLRGLVLSPHPKRAPQPGALFPFSQVPATPLSAPFRCRTSPFASENYSPRHFNHLQTDIPPRREAAGRRISSFGLVIDCTKVIFRGPALDLAHLASYSRPQFPPEAVQLKRISKTRNGGRIVRLADRSREHQGMDQAYGNESFQDEWNFEEFSGERVGGTTPSR